ncbi:MAG: hypothetical protein ACKVYV_00090 [Limisphaerales bacterium]
MERLILETPLAWMAAGFLLGLWLAYEAGYAGGGRARRREADSAPDFGTIQGAVLGLLGLLLAFTYSLASSRHDTRKQIVVHEANAIGTAWLRAELLPEPARVEFRDQLRRYLEARILPDGADTDTRRFEEALRKSESLHADLWATTIRSMSGRTPTELDGLVVVAVNEVIDVHSQRVAASLDHVPWIVLLLLFVAAAFSMALTGFGCGLSRRRNHTLTITLAAMIVAVTTVILDLDRPRRGFIKVPQRSLINLQQSLDAEAGR